MTFAGKNDYWMLFTGHFSFTVSLGVMDWAHLVIIILLFMYGVPFSNCTFSFYFLQSAILLLLKHVFPTELSKDI